MGALKDRLIARGYDLDELEQDNPYNQWMKEIGMSSEIFDAMGDWPTVPEDAFDGLGEAESFDRDLMALVSALRALLRDMETPRTRRATDAWTEARRALDQFEPWLEQDNDPRSMGWVDDRGRP